MNKMNYENRLMKGVSMDIPYYNKTALLETLDRMIPLADKEDMENLKQIKECIEWPLRLHAIQEAEYHLVSLAEDILNYEESDMKESIVRLANKLYCDCETFNNGEAPSEMAETFWNEEKKLYYTDKPEYMNNNFLNFVDAVKESIKDHLPESYKNCSVNIVNVKKLDISYTGLALKKNDESASVTISLNDAYDSYKNAIRIGVRTSIDKICNAIVKTLVTEVPEKSSIQSASNCISDYEQVKNKLFICVSSAKKNADFLQTVPHKIVEDLAITYHVALDNDATFSSIITNQIMKNYKISQNTLHSDAIKSAPTIRPMNVMNMGFITVLTNKTITYGAASIFYPGVLDALCEFLESDIFILPSSVHELIICKNNGLQTIDELKSTVSEVNGSPDCISPKDILSYEVYHYDPESRVFETVKKYQKRISK